MSCCPTSTATWSHPETATWQKRIGPRLLECLFSVYPEDRSLVDVCRQALTDSTDEMHALCDEYRDKFELDAKLHYTERRGTAAHKASPILDKGWNGMG
jgi:hypothetical protein